MSRSWGKNLSYFACTSGLYTAATPWSQLRTGHPSTPKHKHQIHKRGWHNLGFPPHTSRAPTHAGRTIQRHSSKGREEEQGTHLPRTPPGSAVPPRCLRDWSWRTLEWWGGNFPEAPRPHQSPPSPSPSAPLPHQRPDPPLERHAHARGHACLRSIQTYQAVTTLKATPLHQWDPRWSHQPPTLLCTSGSRRYKNG